MATHAQTPTIQHETGKDRAALLRNSLRLDAGLVVGGGAFLLALAAPVADALGIAEATILSLDGAGFVRANALFFLLWGPFLFYAATRTPLNRALAWVVIGVNVMYALAIYITLLAGWLPLTTVGVWALLIGADGVLAIAIAEYVGLRRLGR